MPSNLLQRGATWLGGKLQAAGGRAVVYRRGTKYVAITATPQMHKETVVGNEGVATEVDVYSWTVTAADLVGLVAGETFEPQERDVIEETLNGAVLKWQVLPLGNDKQCWEWLDSSGLLFLVHTKRMP